MGSEGVQSTRIYITGFKKFHGVFENPTEVIVSRLKDFMKGHELPSGATLGSCTVLETAGEGALNNLLKVLDSAISEEDSGTQPGEKIDGAQRIVWVHFGVNSGATRFAVERRAVNEATFRCPDEMGWQPQRVPIVAEDGPISTTRQTTLPVGDIVDYLLLKGFEVALSDDAGRFVCNYVYYHSLCHAAAAHGTQCIFVHVPLFSRIKEDIQMKFAAALLEIIAACW
ncbi:hypothetical protein O6H91_16G006300 [Diphasiastrum complanatum]|uniref:Uncharacterized protein n=1 Tax=Diphasiastrum complanatum TaxID=34168 RepID=A0ACC2BAI7_DIPCM|nr:hypothetical protein O6H91_Y446000 [Diphasiastrum complanatum]KAJ7526434.1 hypothetical protein O6H91_16G006300 [Diphasiastrum complanatum]